MATTVGETISRVRNVVKGVKEDPFMTDRFLYSLISKYAKLLIKRQDNENKIMKFQSLFKVLPCVELIEIDKVEACCSGIKTNCTIYRTKDKLPELFEGSYGPLFRNITSLDRSIVLYKTNPTTYTAMTHTTSFKYNKNKYFWYLEGYLYFPNLIWDGVLVEGLWTESVAYLQCKGDTCTIRQDDEISIPEFLFAEIEQMVLKELQLTLAVAQEKGDDSQNQLR